jgi:hypothetical protein
VVKTAFTVLVGSLLMMLVACSGEDAGSSAEQKSSAAPATGGARVTVKADKTHAVQPGDEITLTISVDEFRLAPESIGDANQEGVGHYRVYLDDASGESYIAVGAQPTTKVTIPADISDGSHDLRVVLHNNDKSPVEPGVEGSVLLIVYRL